MMRLYIHLALKNKLLNILFKKANIVFFGMVQKEKKEYNSYYKEKITFVRTRPLLLIL